MSWSGRVVLVATVLLCGPRALQAESQDLSALTIEDLLEVEVSVATLESSTLVRSPSTVTVISREMIRAYGFRTVTEALDVIAGYSTVRTYSTRSTATMRGLLNFHYANKVLILVDGIPAWSAVTGHANLERIGIDAVERIELLKGPASVLYGTNAYAGAINIVLREADANSTSAHGAIGTQGAYAAGAEARVVRGALRARAAAEVYDDGVAAPMRFIDEDGVVGSVQDFARGGNAVASLRYRHHELVLNTFEHQYMRFGTTPTFDDGAGHDQLHRGLLVGYRAHVALGGRGDLLGSVVWDDNTRNFDRSADGQTRTNDHGWRLATSLGSRIDVRDDLYVEVGTAYDFRKSVEYRNYLVRDDVTLSDNNMRDRDMWEASLFGQAGYAGSRVSAILGTRVTRNQLFGLNLASRSTVSYALGEHHAVKLVAGQSFRAPSLFELYFTTDSGTVRGNPDLEPETSTSYELVYLGATGGLVAHATAYYARYQGIIYRTLIDGINEYRNGQTTSALGLELELRYHAAARTDAFVTAHYLRDLSPRVTAGEGYAILQFAPALTGDAGASHRVGPFTLSGIAHFRGATSGPVARIGFAWTVDAGAAYHFDLSGAEAELRLDARNLGDQRVDIPEYVRRDTVNAIPLDGFGRQLFLALRWER